MMKESARYLLFFHGRKYQYSVSDNCPQVEGRKENLRVNGDVVHFIRPTLSVHGAGRVY